MPMSIPFINNKKVWASGYDRENIQRVFGPFENKREATLEMGHESVNKVRYWTLETSSLQVARSQIQAATKGARLNDDGPDEGSATAEGKPRRFFAPFGSVSSKQGGGLDPDDDDESL